MIFAGALILAAACTPEYTFQLDENLGICRTPDKSELAKSAGASYIEIGISKFLMPEASDEEYAENRKAALNSALPVRTANGFFPPDLALVGPDADKARALAYTEVAAKRGAELGIEVFVLGSGKARNIPEGYDRAEAEKQFVDLCRGIADICKKYNIVVVIEPLRPQETNFITSVREGTRIVRMVNHPYLKVLADFYHMAQAGEDAGAIVEAGDDLRHCHIAENVGRTCPGVNGDDFTPYFKALKEIKYKGRLSFECGWKNIEEQIGPSFEYVREQIRSIK